MRVKEVAEAATRVNQTCTGADANCGVTLVMAVPGQENAAPWIVKRVADRPVTA